jgi:hypothetical protein
MNFRSPQTRLRRNAQVVRHIPRLCYDETSLRGGEIHFDAIFATLQAYLCTTNCPQRKKRVVQFETSTVNTRTVIQWRKTLGLRILCSAMLGTAVRIKTGQRAILRKGRR